MVNHGSIRHQKLILDTMLELQNEGYNVIGLQKGIPDAIATKDDLIYAVKSLIVSYVPKKGIEDMDIIKNKRKLYSGFDGIVFKLSDKQDTTKLYFFETLRKPKTFTNMNANKIVDDWISKTFEGK